MKIIIGNTYSKLEGATKEVLDMVDDSLAVKQPGYFFSPSFKNGYWDGKIRFFNKKENSFPTGLLEKVRNVLGDIVIEDSRKRLAVKVPDAIELLEPEATNGIITLRDYQQQAVANALKAERGIVNVATNGGKTEIAAGIIKCLLPFLKKGQKILFVTHSKELFSQSAKRLEKRLGISVGRIGSGEWIEKDINVVMIPTVSKYLKPPKLGKITYTKEMKAISLIKLLLGNDVKSGESNRKIMIDAIQVLEEQDEDDYDEKAIEILSAIVLEEKTDSGCLKKYEELKKALKDFEEKKIKKELDNHRRTIDLLESTICFIGDEFHRGAGDSFYDTLMFCNNAIYRFGLTGTLDQKDEIKMMRVFGLTGDVVSKISNDFLISKGFSAKPTIYLQKVSEPSFVGLDYQGAYEKGIVENEKRNRLIADKVEEKHSEGKGCLIIVNRKKHGENIKKLLEERGIECEFTHGSFDNREGVLEDFGKGSLKVLISTNILDEGVDVSSVDALWMAAAGKSFRMVLQRVGRGLRVKKDGGGLEVYDFLDLTSEYLTKHSQERYQYYKTEKFEIKGSWD